MDQAQNTFSALQTLAFWARFPMRWFVFGADPDQVSNSTDHMIKATTRQGQALDLGASLFRIDNNLGGALALEPLGSWEGAGRFVFRGAA